MFRGTAVVDRFGTRRLLILSGVILGLLAPASASATITSVFGGTVTCTTQSAVGEEGQRWCGNTAGTTVPSLGWHAAIDVAVAFPPATGSDNDYPVVGIYPAWGGTKVLPSSSAAQRWLKLGYAVFSETDRGWGSSCGGPSKPANTLKAAPCEDGYIHPWAGPMKYATSSTCSACSPTKASSTRRRSAPPAAATAAGCRMQLGSLEGPRRTDQRRTDPVEKAGRHTDENRRHAPEYPWSDLAQALQPNGSNLDYVADAPYSGMLGNHEFGIQKKNWNEALYEAGCGPRVLRADVDRRPRSQHHRMVQLQQHRRPLQRSAAGHPAGRTAAQPRRRTTRTCLSRLRPR